VDSRDRRVGAGGLAENGFQIRWNEKAGPSAGCDTLPMRNRRRHLARQLHGLVTDVRIFGATRNDHSEEAERMAALSYRSGGHAKRRKAREPEQ